MLFAVPQVLHDMPALYQLLALETLHEGEVVRIARTHATSDMQVYTIWNELSGHRVERSAMSAIYYPHTGIFSVNGRLQHPSQELRPGQIPAKKIEKIIRAYLGLAHSDPLAISSRVLVSSGASEISYSFKALCREPQSITLHSGEVDAYTGIVRKTNNDRVHSIRKLTGQGYVYRFSPLDGPPQQIALERMLSPSELKGESVFVLNNDDSKPTATGEGGLFPYGEGDERIGHVMLYYYLDAITDWYHSKHKFPKGKQIVAYANVKQVFETPLENNAAFVGTFHIDAYGGTYPIIVFSTADATHPNVMLNADIIAHEFTHFIIDSITHMSDVSIPTQNAIHEGYADYFAATLTSDPEIGEYFVQPLGKPYLRNLAGDDHVLELPLPDRYVRSAHEFGQVFAQAAWELRQRLAQTFSAEEAKGIELADSLMYRSLHYYNNATDDPRLMAKAWVELDSNLHGGKHMALLLHVLYQNRFVIPGSEIAFGAPSEPAESSPIAAQTGAPIDIEGISPVVDPRRQIAHHWIISARPQGSVARIADPFTKVARFIPDLPGRYMLDYVVAYQGNALGVPSRVPVDVAVGNGASGGGYVGPESASGCGLITSAKRLTRLSFRR